MRVLAVLGRDVTRSLSPKIHNAAARALDLPITYVPISCPTVEKFNRAIDALRELDAIGANVTIPYKEQALARANLVTAVGKAIGAVNTLTFVDENTIEGDNTDGPALAAMLRTMRAERLQKVQVLGSGGAAKAAEWALKDAGAAAVVVCARRLGNLAPVPGATLVISTLPPEPDLRFEEYIDLAARPAILDVAYVPDGLPPLVAFARARGLDASDGRAMLVEQGARSLARWTGKDLSLIREAMFSVLYSGPVDD
jgi:shikimate dehydrogenase